MRAPNGNPVPALPMPNTLIIIQFVDKKDEIESNSYNSDPTFDPADKVDIHLLDGRKKVKENNLTSKSARAIN